MLKNSSQESEEQSKRKWIQFLICDWLGHGVHSISLNVTTGCQMTISLKITLSPPS